MHTCTPYILVCSLKHRAHVIRIDDPSDAQTGFFRRCFGTKRFVFNNGQRVWQSKYEAKEKTSSNIIRNYFVAKKKEAGLEWLGDVPKSVIQGAAEDLGNAYSRFFKKVSCYPKQKHRKDSEQSAVVNNDGHAKPKKPKQKFMSNQTEQNQSKETQTLTVSLIESFVTYENHGNLTLVPTDWPELEGKSKEEIAEWLNKNKGRLYVDCENDPKLVREEAEDGDVMSLSEFWSEAEVLHDKIKDEERFMVVS